MVLAVAFERRAQSAFFAKSEASVRVERRLVELEDAQADAAQATLLEAVAQDLAYRIRPVTPTPILRRSDDDREVRRTIRLADVHEAYDPDRTSPTMRVDGEGILRRRELPVLEEPAYRAGGEWLTGPTREAPDLMVSVPPAVEIVVQALVATKLD